MFCYYYCCQSETTTKKKQFAFRGQSLSRDRGGRAGREDEADKFIILNGTYWTTIPESVRPSPTGNTLVTSDVAVIALVQTMSPTKHTEDQ